MHIAIIGTGGVGGYFGGRLALAGNKVTFVARGAHYQQMKQYGLRVKSILGDFILPEVDVVNAVQELHEPELVFVCTKAWQVKEVGEMLASVVHPSTVVIPLQNGVMGYDNLIHALPPSMVVNGLCKILSKIESPGVIHHAGFDPTLVFGEQSNEHTDRVLRIADCCRQAGIKTVVPSSIQTELWKKFIYICAHSGVGALKQYSLGQLLADAHSLTLLRGCMSEIFEVSKAKGVFLPEDIVDKTIDFMRQMPPEATSSMQRDIAQGKPSELQNQNGAVVNLGKELGVPTPVNDFILASLLLLENLARGVC